jgi:hypothetical protein
MRGTPRHEAREPLRTVAAPVSVDLLVDALQGDELGEGGTVDESVHGWTPEWVRTFGVVTNLAVRTAAAIGRTT